VLFYNEVWNCVIEQSASLHTFILRFVSVTFVERRSRRRRKRRRRRRRRSSSRRRINSSSSRIV